MYASLVQNFHIKIEITSSILALELIELFIINEWVNLVEDISFLLYLFLGNCHKVIVVC